MTLTNVVTVMHGWHVEGVVLLLYVSYMYTYKFSLYNNVFDQVYISLCGTMYIGAGQS